VFFYLFLRSFEVELAIKTDENDILLFCVISTISNDTRFFSTSFAVHCCLVWCVGVPQSFLRSITNVISKPLLKFSLSFESTIDTVHVQVLELQVGMLVSTCNLPCWKDAPRAKTGNDQKCNSCRNQDLLSLGI